MSKIQFVVNPNPKYIDKNADGYILLNESLIRDENEQILKGKYRFLKQKMITEEEYLNAKKYVIDLSDRIIGYYGKRMNKWYNYNFTSQQWKYYIGIWLEDFIFDVFVRYNKIKAIEEDVYMVTNNVDTVLSNQREYGFINGYDPDYQMALYSLLFQILGKTVSVVPEKQEMIRTFGIKLNKWKARINIVRKNPHKIIEKIQVGKENAELKFKGISLIVESRMPKTMEDEISEKCDGKVKFVEADYFWKKMNPIIKKVSLNLDGRQKVFRDFIAVNEFEKLIDELLITFLPLSFFEGLSGIYKKASEMVKDLDCKKIYHSAHITELFAMCCVLMKEKNTEIIDIQHSATYSVLYCLGFKEFDVWDRFLTWGWKNTEVTFHNIFPVAMSRLPSCARQKYQQKEKILLATGIPELCDYGAGWNYDRYVVEQKAFISSLTEDVREKLVIRVRVSDKKMSGGLISWCEKNYPEVKFENMNEISFVESLMESQLLVCDYYGTPHLEALMMGKPFTMFEGACIYVYNPAIKHHIEAMKKLGLYKNSGRELALEISNHKDINKWLNTKEVNSVLKSYMYDVTNSDKDIVKEWIKELVESRV